MTAGVCGKLALLLLPLAFALPASGQAKYTGYGPGSFSAAGLTGSVYQSDYGQRRLVGTGLYLDGNLYRRVGLEASVRKLNLHTDENVRESTYLLGPRVSLGARKLRPYVRLLAGRGHLDFPFGYAQGNYFVVAPGGGVDWRVEHTRLSLRLIDVEYQRWPQFTFGALHPYGISSGLSVTFYSLHPRLSHY